ncbi:hypothetical protein HYN69_04305 [Gemmobacter aquarius]|uniref:Uncharacterized protein n=2 Tax=Paragemmobacter aquarius TaxID=2169400 RepID=A0A2S0UJ53_9RHOB|nr:hypothetical protein HYN69_04305 [Gemmobacter aquarius]
MSKKSLSAIFVCALLDGGMARAEDIDCKKIAWHAQLVMSARQMNADINKAMEMTIKRDWPFGRSMVLEAYELPLAPKDGRSGTAASVGFANEWGRRCLAGELD